MASWPKSRWGQAGIALAASFVISAFVFDREYKSEIAEGIRTAPHDGLIGLSALMGAFDIGFTAFLMVFLVLFLVQFVFGPREENIPEK